MWEEIRPVHVFSFSFLQWRPGETSSDSSLLEYRRFLFSDPHFSGTEESTEEKIPFAGLITLEVMRFLLRCQMGLVSHADFLSSSVPCQGI